MALLNKKFNGILCVFVFSLNVMNGEDKAPAYLQYVNEISKEVAANIQDELDLIYIGGGGKMPRDVEELSLKFLAYRKASIEQARKLEVIAVQKLLNSINTHKPIKPFLREHPFPSRRAEVSISFRKKNNEHEIDHSISYVTQLNNILYYCIEDIKKDKLVTIYEEPYEEALKIVQNQSPPEKL